jgi:NAD(P)-dependent dehydrogenase (short-subunit alcohol dehydrogenase family)
MPTLTGQVALVTGAAGDLGNEMALHLAREGASVVLWDVKPEAEAKARIERVRAFGQYTQFVRYAVVDVTDRAAVDAAMADIPRLDIVCSNAGIVQSAPFLDVTPEVWQRHLDVNLTGSFHVCQSAARKMVATQTEGRIILTSSWVSSIPWPEITPYTVSKAGVDMLTKQMARELSQYKIRVNAIAPGIVMAGMAGKQYAEEPQYRARADRVIPLGAAGTPVEIAQAVVYLSSPATAYMTGTILVLDGGCSLFQFDS